jgi:glutamine synthetase
VQNNLPDDLRRIYVDMKSDEWARYCGAVTEWEFNQYWQAIP